MILGVSNIFDIPEANTIMTTLLDDFMFEHSKKIEQKIIIYS